MSLKFEKNGMSVLGVALLLLSAGVFSWTTLAYPDISHVLSHDEYNFITQHQYSRDYNDGAKLSFKARVVGITTMTNDPDAEYNEIVELQSLNGDSSVYYSMYIKGYATGFYKYGDIVICTATLVTENNSATGYSTLGLHAYGSSMFNTFYIFAGDTLVAIAGVSLIILYGLNVLNRKE